MPRFKRSMQLSFLRLDIFIGVFEDLAVFDDWIGGGAVADGELFGVFVVHFGEEKRQWTGNNVDLERSEVYMFAFLYAYAAYVYLSSVSLR